MLVVTELNICNDFHGVFVDIYDCTMQGIPNELKSKIAVAEGI